jgi:hypothetical protein
LDRQDFGTTLADNIRKAVNRPASLYDDLDSLISEYPALGNMAQMVDVLAEAGRFSEDEANLCITGVIANCLTLVGAKASEQLKAEMKSLDRFLAANEIMHVLYRQNSLSEADDLVGSLEIEYPTLGHGGLVALASEQSLGLSSEDATLITSGVLAANLALKQVIDHTELESIPTIE